MTGTTVSISTLQDYYWLIGALLCVAGFLFMLGYRARKVQQRVEMLEKHDEMQRKDIAVLVMADFAILDGLRQLGCNGKVTTAHEGLQEHIANNRYTIV